MKAIRDRKVAISKGDARPAVLKYTGERVSGNFIDSHPNPG